MAIASLWMLWEFMRMFRRTREENRQEWLQDNKAIQMNNEKKIRPKRKYVVFLNFEQIKRLKNASHDSDKIRVEFEEQEDGSWVGSNKTLLSAQGMVIV